MTQYVLLYYPNSDKPKPNWNRKGAKGAKVYIFFLCVLRVFAVQKIFAFCTKISLEVLNLLHLQQIQFHRRLAPKE